MATNSTVGTLGVAAALCIVCSILVSTAAVKLKPIQTENKNLDIKKNLLLSAGLIKDSNVTKAQIQQAFEKVETKVVDLSTGSILSDVDPAKVDLKKRPKTPTSMLSFLLIRMWPKLNIGPKEVRFILLKKMAKFPCWFFLFMEKVFGQRCMDFWPWPLIQKQLKVLGFMSMVRLQV